MSGAVSRIQLVLADLDNVLRDRRGPLPQPCVRPEDDFDWLDRRGAGRAPAGEGVPCVVVFAMNLRTADDPAISFAALHAFAEALASVVAGAPLRGVEVGLTLPIKQSADKALERLLAEAPLDDHAGMLEAVHVVSQDRGLREDVGKQLGGKYRSVPRDECLAWTWTLVGKKGTSRAKPRPSREGLRIAGEPSVSAMQSIDTPELVVWAQGQSVQMPRAEGLDGLVHASRARPGLLTQIGLTRTSVRGVRRLHGLADGQVPRIGACDVSDGLEWCAEDVPPGRFHEPVESSLGPGALRFRRSAATVRTLLPPGVLAVASESLLVGDLAMLDDASVLRRLPAQALRSCPPFKVRFSVRGNALKAEIVSGFAAPLPAWWFRGKETMSEIVVEALGSVLAGQLTVEGALDLDPRRVVQVRAPYWGAVVAHVARAIPPGTLGRATIDGRPVAVFAHPDGVGLAPGNRVCRAIQEWPDDELDDVFPGLPCSAAMLKPLPVLVPL